VLPAGDIVFDGTSWPRTEVIRNTRGETSYKEGLLRRETASDLFAGYDAEGYYTDEDLLGAGYPQGIWTSPHDNLFGSYEARNSLTPAVAPPGPTGWSAYNDLAAPNNTAPTTNITVITTPDGGNVGLPDSGELIDFNTGSGTGVTLAVTGGLFNGISHTVAEPAGQSGEPASGTDAFGVFDGFLNALGTISYNNSPSPGGDLVLTFTGMDPGKYYNLVYYGHRDDYAWDRAALVTLSGAIAFTNESTAASDNPDPGSGGTLFDGPTDDSTRLPSDNDNGYVARFTDVISGSDGEVLLRVSFGGTPGNEYKGKYANAFMMEETGDASLPQFALTTDMVGNGIVTLNPPGGVYDAGTSVQVLAEADPDWTFSGWSGDLSGSTNPETIVMTGDMNVTANFVLVPGTWTTFIDLNAQVDDNNDTYVLPIVPGTGNVPIDPATIWKLRDSSGGAFLPVTMNVAMDVRYPTTNGADSDPTTDAGQTFGGIVDGVGGFEVDLVNSFMTLHFNNLDPGEEYSLAVTYNRDDLSYTNRATRFTLEDADAFTNASTPGVVVHSEASVAFSTGSNFANGYVARWTGITDADGHIAITAIQDQSQPGWNGSKGYTMTSVMLVQGVVAPPQYALTVTPVGNGSVTLNPTGGVYDAGTSVQVLAEADPGWEFSSWSGDLSSSVSPETILMDGDKNVTATFMEIPAGPMVCENFDSGFALGAPVGAHPDWFDGGSGPVVTDLIGVAGSVGLPPASAIYTWTNQPFDWNAPDFVGVNFRSDFQTDGDGGYDDDRIGWMITNTSNHSNNIFGVQMDPVGDTAEPPYNIECYWDGDTFGDNGGRTSIVTLPGLTANGWYRLQANITRLTDTSAQIDVSLWELDGSGIPTVEVASGSISDTALLPNDTGNERPNPGYFTGPIWPAYKNHSATTGAADNACYEIITTAPPFAFVVVADSRTQSHLAGFEADLTQVQDWVNSPAPDMPAPEMLVFVGDFDHTSQTDGIIETVLGAGFPWYYVIGNHDFETIADFDECKDTIFPTLPGVVNSGPAGSIGTNYSWDYGNAHFVSVNAYWDGTTNAGADHATSGDIPVPLRTWIGDDLAASSQPHKFVFVHEPAYPEVRHIGDSLDAYPANRDAFVTTLDDNGTEALFVGHDHYYHHDVASEYPLLGNVHQVDAGQIQGPNVGGDGSTIIYVLVDGDMTTYKVYRSMTGTFTLFEEWTIGGPMPLILAESKSLPTRYSLSDNYPNPFNPSTTIKFTMPTSGRVKLSIFDIQGRLISTLVDEEYSVGRHEVIWKGRDNSNRSVSSGTYFYRITTKGFVETKKMLLLK